MKEFLYKYIRLPTLQNVYYKYFAWLLWSNISQKSWLDYHWNEILQFDNYACFKVAFNNRISKFDIYAWFGVTVNNEISEFDNLFNRISNFDNLFNGISNFDNLCEFVIG